MWKVISSAHTHTHKENESEGLAVYYAEKRLEETQIESISCNMGYKTFVTTVSGYIKGAATSVSSIDHRL